MLHVIRRILEREVSQGQAEALCITPIVVPYVIPYITPFKELREGIPQQIQGIASQKRGLA